MEKRIQFLSHMVSRPHLCAWLLLPSVTLVIAGCFSHSGGSYIGHVRYYNKLPRARWLIQQFPNHRSGMRVQYQLAAAYSAEQRHKLCPYTGTPTSFVTDSFLPLWHHEVLTTYRWRHLWRPSCHPGGAKKNALTLACRGTYTAHAHAVPLLICIWESLYFLLTASQGWQRPASLAFLRNYCVSLKGGFPLTPKASQGPLCLEFHVSHPGL